MAGSKIGVERRRLRREFTKSRQRAFAAVSVAMFQAGHTANKMIPMKELAKKICELDGKQLTGGKGTAWRAILAYAGSKLNMPVDNLYKRPVPPKPSPQPRPAKAEKTEQAATLREMRATFYDSPQWIRLRYKALLKYGRKCMACGSTERIHVDHIKPRSKYPRLELDLGNLQILCHDCNMGKSAWDETDFRPK